MKEYYVVDKVNLRIVKKLMNPEKEYYTTFYYELKYYVLNPNGIKTGEAFFAEDCFLEEIKAKEHLKNYVRNRDIVYYMIKKNRENTF